MSNFIGIDLGTTYSAVAYIDDTGRPVILRDSRGANLTPSVVAMSDGELLVGEPARTMWAEDPSTALARFKREMGTSRNYSLAGRDFTPGSLSAKILEKLKHTAASQIGEIGDAVVTVPANFSSEARSETLEAARQAGLQINSIIDEPTAAALYYAYANHKELSGLYAVYDFGGGTFDVSIIRVEGKDIEVVSSSGVARLGGDDFDRAMQALVQEKYEAEYGEKLTGDAYTLDSAEANKRTLTELPKCKAGPSFRSVSVSRDEYEKAIQNLIGQAEMACEAALEEADIAPEHLEAVFLAGGTTRIPAVVRSVTQVFGKEPLALANVDEVVALGAAIYAAFKGDKAALNPAQELAISAIKALQEVTHENYGTMSVGFNEEKSKDELQNTVIIERGSKVPVEVTKSFYTIAENQDSVNCVVTSSIEAETDPRFVKIVWEGELPLPPNRPAGQKIDVSFGYTENKTMTARFIDVASGKTTEIDLHGLGEQKGSGINKFKV